MTEAEEVRSTEAVALLHRSIDYHDPDGVWSRFRGTLVLDEIRPDGSGRTAEVDLHVPGGGFEYRASMNGRDVVKTVADGVCAATVGGNRPDSATTESLRLTCPGLERSRNYYLFLWGLPMKLTDPGTLIDPEVREDTFEGQPVNTIRVTYDPEVGADIWYFYFHPETAALVGYRFYHDESVNDGEYITLAGETEVAGMRLPARRQWFVNADGRFLGEDALQSGRAGG